MYIYNQSTSWPQYSPSVSQLSTSWPQSSPSMSYPSTSWPQVAPARPFCPLRREDTVQSNLAQLFRPHTLQLLSRKRKREVPWRHVFVCLPEPKVDQVHTPEEAHFFSLCGLGKKTVCFPNNEGDHLFLNKILCSAFPLLQDAGGYVLARSDRSKRLLTIPIPPAGYSLGYLRSCPEVKRAPLYIVPLQCGLPLCPPVDVATPVMERCLTCMLELPLCDLAKHLNDW